MYVQVRTIDGERNVVLIISKLTTVEDLKIMIEKEMSVEPDLQRLFYRGKQLENGYKLFDYHVNLNDVIQLMVKGKIHYISPKKVLKQQHENNNSKDMDFEIDDTNEKTKVQSTNDDNREEKANSVDKEVEAESLYYAKGDLVDCIDTYIGAWFEATIEKILKIEDDLVYRLKWDNTEAGNTFEAFEKDIRPRARRLLKFDDLEIGQCVMINHNIDKPRDLGYWFDIEISKIHKTRTVQQLVGTLFTGRDRISVEGRRVDVKGNIYAIETPKLLSDRNPEDDEMMRSKMALREVAANCSNCLDDPDKKCRECGCRVCSGKDDAHLILLCDECNDAYHTRCLNPPLSSLPSEDDWYCPRCKNDENEIVRAGEKLKQSKKKSKAVTNGDGKDKRDWGKGMACVGRTRECTLVPPNHRGSIPGVEVGTCWKFRVQVSEAGIHRPHVAGIHGRETDCAYSLVLSGGYEDDIDDGDEFLYTGSGGRDLSGNKRTAEQSCDQTLTRMNRALALNCNAKLNKAEGAEATDWKNGIPVRVVRNYKLAKHSKYAPAEGNRYDGLYKVVKYYREPGKSGFSVWRYVLRRDDLAPAPWSTEGKLRIRSLGLEIIYPDGYLEATTTASKRSVTDDAEQNISKIEGPPKKRQKCEGYELDKETTELIKNDEVNAKLWNECQMALIQGKASFLKRVSERFICVCCHEIVYRPVTTSCVHNICLSCLKRSFTAGVYSCPCCRHPLEAKCQMQENRPLGKALLILFPGYQAGRS